MINLTVTGLNDSHFHILEMDNKNIDVEQEIIDWKNNGGHYLIDIGTNENDFKLRKKYSDKFPFIYHSLGIHPNNCGGNLKDRTSLLRQELDCDNKRIVAIGETGLDYYRQKVDKEIQKEFLIAHIDLAIKYYKPIIIHNRDASKDIISILKKYKGKLNGIIHCFSTNKEDLKEFIDLGFYISFSGNLTYKKNIEIQEALKYVPLDRLLIETDSPFLSPIPKRGRLNTPNNIMYTFDYINNVLKVERLKKRLEINLINIFKL